MGRRRLDGLGCIDGLNLRVRHAALWIETKKDKSCENSNQKEEDIMSPITWTHEKDILRSNAFRGTRTRKY